MKLINRHGPCRGITLFRLFSYNIELWFCPKGYTIEKHSHPKEEIELMFIKGDTTFYRLSSFGEVQYYIPAWTDIFQTFSVKPGQVHWFSVSNKSLIFINFSRFIDGKPTSAANDFQLT